MNTLQPQIGQPLSDLQEYNIRLKENTRAIYTIGLIGIVLGLAIFGFLFWYVHEFQVLSNLARYVGGC